MVTAQHTSVCSSCGAPIEPGDRILWSKALDDWVHAEDVEGQRDRGATLW